MQHHNVNRYFYVNESSCDACDMYVCMYVSMYACMYVCIYVCMYICMYICKYVRMYAGMHVCMYVCTYAFMYVCMYICMCVYVCMYRDVCMYLAYINQFQNTHNLIYVYLTSPRFTRKYKKSLIIGAFVKNYVISRCIHIIQN